MKLAILIDGSFFLKRYASLNKNKSGFNQYDPAQTAKDIMTIVYTHLNWRTDRSRSDDNQSDEKFYLYRVFYYDSMPFSKGVHHPLSKKFVNFSNSQVSKFRLDLFEELKRKRKVALRLGEVKDHAGWVLKPQKTKALLNNKITIEQLQEDDLYYDLTQKGVAMRIGLDIAALSYKRLVDRIVLISGDSDFVPAAKVARREGIDFILDPMWNHIDKSLFEHIDGLRSAVDKPRETNASP